MNSPALVRNSTSNEHGRAANALGEPDVNERLPERPFLQHLQALEDAIMYRRARAAAPCPNCDPSAPDGRCDDHAVDLCLVAAYRQTAKSLDAAMTAARQHGEFRPTAAALSRVQTS
jgi:hypothetical protein